MTNAKQIFMKSSETIEIRKLSDALFLLYPSNLNVIWRIFFSNASLFCSECKIAIAHCSQFKYRIIYAHQAFFSNCRKKWQRKFEKSSSSRPDNTFFLLSCHAHCNFLSLKFLNTATQGALDFSYQGNRVESMFILDSSFPRHSSFRIN